MSLCKFEVVIAQQVASGQGDYPHGWVQTAFAKQVVERWQQLVQGQVTRATEDQNVARNSQTTTLHVRLTGRVAVHVV